MPTLKHQELEDALGAILTLVLGRARVEGGGVVRDAPTKLSGMTGVKLSRLKRKVLEAYQDLQEQRTALQKRHATLTEKGELKKDAAGHVVYPTPEAEADYRAELKELMEATVEILDSVTLADFRRRERDETGRVSETDDIEPDIIDGLGALLVVVDPPAGAAA